MNSIVCIPQQYTDRFRKAFKQSTGNLLEMADIVTEVRDGFGYKAMSQWLTSTFDLSETTGDKLLNVGKLMRSTPHCGVKDFEKIGPSALYLLASPSTPPEVRDEVIAEAKNGKPISHADVKQRVEVARKPGPITPDEVAENHEYFESVGMGAGEPIAPKRINIKRSGESEDPFEGGVVTTLERPVTHTTTAKPKSVTALDVIAMVKKAIWGVYQSAPEEFRPIVAPKFKDFAGELERTGDLSW